MEANGIPSVPTSNPDFNDQTGLKNLAGWIARYKNLGLRIDEVSPFVMELLENGTLAQFEPSLTGLEAGRWGADGDYERYEFDAQIHDFISLNDGNDWATLHFVFMSKKCMMYIETINQSGTNSLYCALKNTFNAIDVDPLSEEDSQREMSWQEADEIILKYIEYIRSPKIPSVPPAQN